jgi:hypothetical protein
MSRLTKLCLGEEGDDTEVYSTLVKYTDPSDAKVSSYQDSIESSNSY